MHVPTAARNNGYLDKNSRHPGLLAAAVVVHVGLLGAILSYHPEILGVPEKPITLKQFPPAQLPPPEQKQRKQQVKLDPRPQPRDPVVVVPTHPVRTSWPDLPPLPPTGSGLGEGVTEKLAPPVHPVIVGAGIDERFVRDLQPPYPAALERMEIEGSVTVRIQIGTDGRVIVVELVRADDPAFFVSTRDWALKRWRFKPATRDGDAVVTWLTKKVQFRIMR